MVSSAPTSMNNLPSHFMSYTPLIQMPVSVATTPTSMSMAQSGLQWPFYHPQAGEFAGSKARLSSFFVSLTLQVITQCSDSE